MITKEDLYFIQNYPITDIERKRHEELIRISALLANEEVPDYTDDDAEYLEAFRTGTIRKYLAKQERSGRSS